MSEIAPHLSASFKRQSLMKTFGAELVTCADGACEIRAPILPLALQQHGYGHAGLTFSIGDSAMGYAALSTLSETQEIVTADVNIHLVSPAKGDGLIARARVVKHGRRIIVMTADVFALVDGAEKQVAMMTGTMVPVAPPK